MTVVNIQGEVKDQLWRSVEVGEESGSLESAIVSLSTLKEHFEVLRTELQKTRVELATFQDEKIEKSLPDWPFEDDEYF